MSSWEEARFEAGRQEEVPCAYCGHMVQPGDWTCFGCWPQLKPEIPPEDYIDHPRAD